MSILGHREEVEKGKFGNEERPSILLFLSLLLGEEYGILNSKEIAVIPIHPAAFHDFRDRIPAAFVHPFLWKFGFGCGQAKGTNPLWSAAAILRIPRISCFPE